MNKDTELKIRISSEMKKEFQELVSKTNLTVSELVTRFIQEYISDND